MNLRDCASSVALSALATQDLVPYLHWPAGQACSTCTLECTESVRECQSYVFKSPQREVALFANLLRTAVGLCWDIHLPFFERLVLTIPMWVYPPLCTLKVVGGLPESEMPMAWEYTMAMGCNVVAPLDDLIVQLQAYSLAIACTR